MGVGGVQQVMLKVRFAEMQRSIGKELAGSFGLVGDDVRLGTGNLNQLSNLFADQTLVTDKTGILGVTFGSGSLEFGVLLEALESKGLVRTLAEPNLTALSGQEAKFLAGGEYPIPVSNENNTITIEYKPFGVELAFTPRVVDGDIINLAINAAVSGIDTTTSVTANGLSVNAFRRREAETTVEMHDGESFAIAGLLQDDFRDLNGQVPWLGDIPVLGALFRSAEYQRQQTELVVIITPHLVSPTRGEALALPTDRVKPPTEAELFLFGRTAAGRLTSGPAAEVAKQDFSGPYGYVME
jgi:pilus assembly protein CpaC